MEKEQQMLVRKRKMKQPGVFGICAVVAGASAASIWRYVSTRQRPDGEEQNHRMDWGQGMSGDMVTAAGTTAVGMDAVTFDIDFLEDTSLYVEEVYLSNGDTVAAGDKYVKFTDESISAAREELENAALSADLAYRSSAVTYEESRIQAQYDYDVAVLEASYAQQVYTDALAELDTELAAAQKAYQEAQEAYDEYYNAVLNDTFYEDYELDKLKKAYEDAKDLYNNRIQYWEVTEEELESGTAQGDNQMMTLPTLSGSAADNGGDSDSTDNADDSDNTDNGSDSNDTDNEMQKEVSENAPEDGMMQGKGGLSAAMKEAQEAANDRKWILKTVTLLV